jgi:prepilin-type N-terminal cleavage/methylation domain-containing protein
MRNNGKSGFTLVELVIVVAVLAFIALVAVGKFKDIRKESARKTNLASLANIQRAIDTKLGMSDKVSGLFNYCESLVDANCANGAAGANAWDSAGYLDPSGGWTNSGGYVAGIYAGIKSTSVGNYNAGGVSSGVTTDVETAREQNRGLKNCNSFMVRYLHEKEAQALGAVGLDILLYHNYLSGQSSACQGDCGRSLDSDLATRNGGPGFRADMSAFFPVRLAAGVPVAVLKPSKAQQVYEAFGYQYPASADAKAQISSEMDYFQKGGLPRLVCVGLGRSSDITANLFENPPRDNALDSSYYRNYILVFSMKNGTGNTGYTAKFEGVIDPECAPYKQAQYNADWAG